MLAISDHFAFSDYPGEAAALSSLNFAVGKSFPMCCAQARNERHDGTVFVLHPVFHLYSSLVYRVRALVFSPRSL